MRQPLALLSLADPALYETQIHRLSARRERDRWLVPSDSIGVALDGHPEQIAARLARDVPREGYQFRPLAPHRAVLCGKPRIIYRVDALDAVVWGAYSRALSRAIDARIGEHVYSYRSGRSQFTAADDFAAFLREHVAARPDPKTRGVFVLRRDVRRYDETISVSDDSSLWTTLRDLAQGTPLGSGAVAEQLLKASFRPPIVQPDGSAVPLARGMPTGVPTQTIACNVYLIPVDREVLAIEGGFYARFGDDIVFAHADLERARHAADVLDRGIERLGLLLNTQKSVNYWLTANGAAHADASEFRAARKLPYLGLDVAFDGTRLRVDKRRELLRELCARVDNAHAAVAHCALEERAQTVVQVVQAVLDPKHALSHRYTSWLRSSTMTRVDLVELDHLIALHCAQRLAGHRGPRAFRVIPPKRLYDEFHLPSLVHLWDRARRHQGEHP